ncbi:hypothetical protein TOPH_08030 [Tolypocladium ophioglossoides CBS 100239]|uniref:Uncharacterized protein n=1 Tax=Tolypocladium ophioglossoides (strain CBS 100239) TaxID=1163406 RepID=A0A0L0N0L6_TOLOC|nr:hypothetical protein TOPH_08030 [Tolypocladium ophioglossoides CBS 100239]
MIRGCAWRGRCRYHHALDRPRPPSDDDSQAPPWQGVLGWSRGAGVTTGECNTMGILQGPRLLFCLHLVFPIYDGSI